MKIVITGEVTDLGGVNIQDVKEIFIFLRTDKALICRPLKGTVKDGRTRGNSQD
jgi:hypothetical protein